MGSIDFARILAERVLNSIPEGLLLAAFAWLLLRLVGRQNSGTRFAVWFFALLAIVSLPFVSAIPTAGAVTRAVHSEITLPGSYALAIVGAWGLIALLGSARLVLGMWRVCSLREKSGAVDLSSLDSSVRQTIEECNAIRPVELRSSAEVRVPTAIGFFKPVILIPEWVLQELGAEELRAIILHEFAHLRRWDDWTNLAQKMVRALFFFHPAVLWIENRLSLEREMACDDVVLAETKNPSAYARCLVSLAEKSFLRRSLAVAQAAIGRATETSQRLAQILDQNRPGATKVYKPLMAGVTGLAAVCMLAVPEVPRLISFEDSAPATMAGAASDIAVGPQLQKPMVVPALAHLDRAQASPMISAKAVHALRGEPKTILAKHTTRVNRPRVIQASAKRSAPAPQYVVVTESTSFYREGSGVVSVSVWRMMYLTVRQPAARISKASNQT
jgi:beta-lactamase regulating signal transducer with metallopeptidase domain